MTDIEWKDILGYEGRYKVSDNGLVFNVRFNRILTGKTINGYRNVSLPNGSRYRQFYIHRLVMLAFAGECPDGMEVNHKNGIRDDNRLENLEYTTFAQNQRHRVEVLHGNCGERCPRAILTEAKVRYIREQVEAGASTIALGRQFGVLQATINAAVARRTWKHVV